ncbi:unnamed protein product [Protopolystoma xenopodis]|uniref:EGF-like domain-containing protein n=1 Tax=Protopolystoma xenopodis TaxID=117903 RepID=A0A3S5FEV9_9PLAT|nr:unnamed protein product [Protopolystoma xenopodis]
MHLIPECILVLLTCARSHTSFVHTRPSFAGLCHANPSGQFCEETSFSARANSDQVYLPAPEVNQAANIQRSDDLLKPIDTGLIQLGSPEELVNVPCDYNLCQNEASCQNEPDGAYKCHCESGK